MAVHLDQIVPWGRTRQEYERMFALSRQDLSRGLLDCGGGPASFVAELSADGHSAVAVDPIYRFAEMEIRARFDAVAGSILDQVRATPDDWVWSHHRDPDALLAARRAALDRFLEDYDSGRSGGRYVVGELPALPMASGTFGLAVCSHLLFLYSDLLTEAFHVHAVREMCRVAGEVRIFPLLTLERSRSPHLLAVQSMVEAMGWSSQVVKVDYELQRGGNEMLRIFHQPSSGRQP